MVAQLVQLARGHFQVEPGRWEVLNVRPCISLSDSLYLSDSLKLSLSLRLSDSLRLSLSLRLSISLSHSLCSLCQSHYFYKPLNAKWLLETAQRGQERRQGPEGRHDGTQGKACRPPKRMHHHDRDTHAREDRRWRSNRRGTRTETCRQGGIDDGAKNDG